MGPLVQDGTWMVASILDQFVRRGRGTEGTNPAPGVVDAYVQLVASCLSVLGTRIKKMTVATYPKMMTEAVEEVRESVRENSVRYVQTIGRARVYTAAYHDDPEPKRNRSHVVDDSPPGYVVAALSSGPGRSLCVRNLLKQQCNAARCKFEHAELPAGTSAKVLEWVSKQKGSKN